MLLFKTLAKTHKSHFKGLFLFSIITNVLVLAPSIHMLQVYDRVLSSGSKPTLFFLTLIVIFALCIYGAAESLRTRLGQRLAARYSVTIADDFFAALASDPSAAGNASRYLRDYSTVKTFLGGRLIIVLFDLPFIPLFLLIMFLLHWSMGLLTVLGLACMIAIGLFNNKSTEQTRMKSRAADSESIGFAQTVFARAEDLRALGLLPNVMRRWGEKTANSVNAAEGASASTSSFDALGKTFRQILQVTIMGWGAYLVLSGNMSGGMIFLASMVSGKALAPIEQLIGGWEHFMKFTSSLESVDELVRDNKDALARTKLPEPQGVITARNLEFNPDDVAGGRPVIDDMSLVAKPGEITVVVGASGAGKSTLMRMLSGGLRPTSGQVYLDRAASHLWPPAQWGQYIGYVAQEIDLFPGTVAENIARFSPDFPIEEVHKAAKRAACHELIVSFPKGYETVIGDGSFRFSGGQKQRIGLARALFGDPKVLILDEPNAHLDSFDEKRLIKSLSDSKRLGRTIIVVTQRMSLLKVADQVLEIKNGKISELEQKQSPAKESGMNAQQTMQRPNQQMARGQVNPQRQNAGPMPISPQQQMKTRPNTPNPLSANAAAAMANAKVEDPRGPSLNNRQQAGQGSMARSPISERMNGRMAQRAPSPEQINAVNKVLANPEIQTGVVQPIQQLRQQAEKMADAAHQTTPMNMGQPHSTINEQQDRSLNAPQAVETPRSRLEAAMIKRLRGQSTGTRKVAGSANGAGIKEQSARAVSGSLLNYGHREKNRVG